MKKNQCRISETVVKTSAHSWDSQTDGRMDRWMDADLQSALQSACDACIAAASSFLSCLQDSNFPPVEPV